MDNGEPIDLVDDEAEETPKVRRTLGTRPTSTSTGRRYVFTLNNPTGPLVLATAIGAETVRYCVWQREIAPKTGTPHFQGYVEFKKPVRLAHCKKLIPHAHFEIARGDRDQCRTYCMKTDSRDQATDAGPHEYGEFGRGGQGKRSDLLEVKAMVDKGATEKEIADEHFGTWLRSYRGIERYRRLSVPQRTWKTKVVVKYGPPGSGKSRDAMESYPGAYWKPRGIWWDGYEGQGVVILDEFFGWLPWDTLLKLLDRYPLLVETKGGQTQYTPHTVVITTNKRPDRWYAATMPFEALNRRVDEWHAHPEPGSKRVFTGSAGFIDLMKMMGDSWNPQFDIDPKFD